VIRYKETKQKTKKGPFKTTKWMWVTDLDVTPKNIREIVKGARARFHIENQTFNTLKNQGYEFEHNFGVRREAAEKSCFLSTERNHPYHGVILGV